MTHPTWSVAVKQNTVPAYTLLRPTAQTFQSRISGALASVSALKSGRLWGRASGHKSVPGSWAQKRPEIKGNASKADHGLYRRGSQNWANFGPTGLGRPRGPCCRRGEALLVRVRLCLCADAGCCWVLLLASACCFAWPPWVLTTAQTSRGFGKEHPQSLLTLVALFAGAGGCVEADHIRLQVLVLHL